jgi:nitroreductase
MDTFLAIVSRREVRAYDGRPLPDDAVRRILDAGRLAGSSQNRQARRFVVVRSRVQEVAGAVYVPSNVLGAALVVAVVTFGKGPLAFDLADGEQAAIVVSFGYPLRPASPERRPPERWIEAADRVPFDDSVQVL